MSLFFKRFLSVPVLIMSITISSKAQSTTPAAAGEIVDQSNTPLPEADIVMIQNDSMSISVAESTNMVTIYAPEETTLNSDLHLNENTLKAGSEIDYLFNVQHNLTPGYSTSSRATFQKDLFINNTSVKSAAFRRAVFAPTLIMAAGLATLDKDNDDNYEIQQERNRHLPNFRHRVDDYLQHSPILVVYGLNWLGIEGKNDFANRTALLIKSEAMVGILTFSLKRITAVPRPDTKEPTSFPSGHTAQAFATATFLSKEYGHRSIWYSIGAYTVATGIGTMRVMNNRHWVSDVLVGAGIGILSTNLVYLTHQYRWGKKRKGGQTSIIPSYDGQTGMVNIIHRIN